MLPILLTVAVVVTGLLAARETCQRHREARRVSPAPPPLRFEPLPGGRPELN